MNNIGFKMKEKRIKMKLTLKQISSSTGYSISFLSQVERGKSNITLESLRKISDALNVSPSYFFLNEDDSSKSYSFHYEDLSNNESTAFHPILVTLKPKENFGNEFSHTGHEFIYVVDGILTVTIEGVEQQLTPGQSIMFNSSKNHYWWNASDETTKFLLVSSSK